MICARALLKQGFIVNIFDEIKDKGTSNSRYIEDIIEYMPIICDHYKDQSIIKMFSEFKLHYGVMNLEIDVVDKEQKFLSEDNLEYAEKKFFEIINEIISNGMHN